MGFAHTLDGTSYRFADLKELLAKASPRRSGDELAGIAAGSGAERVAAQMALADLPLRQFLTEALIPYEQDEVTRLVVDTHDAAAFAPVASMTVGEFREWLLGDAAHETALRALAPGITPEMAAAVSKIMRLQDLIAVASKCRTVTAFRNTIGLAGRLSTRLQPNHPTDHPPASLQALWMVSCMGRVTRSSASIRSPTASRPRQTCSPCWTKCAFASMRRYRRACFRM